MNYDVKAVTIWFTGLSGAGKSTLARALAAHEVFGGRAVSVLDGDVLRTGLCKDLGFGLADRRENVRRVAEVARLMNDAGVTAVCALISPLVADRVMAREIVGEDRFAEVFVAASLAACEARDPKGLYRRARLGQLPMFTGIDSAYEPPSSPEVVLHSGDQSVRESVEQLVSFLREWGRQIQS